MLDYFQVCSANYYSMSSIAPGRGVCYSRCSIIIRLLLLNCFHNNIAKLRIAAATLSLALFCISPAPVPPLRILDG